VQRLQHARINSDISGGRYRCMVKDDKEEHRPITTNAVIMQHGYNNGRSVHNKERERCTMIFYSVHARIKQRRTPL